MSYKNEDWVLKGKEQRELKWKVIKEERGEENAYEDEAGWEKKNRIERKAKSYEDEAKSYKDEEKENSSDTKR